MLPKGGGSHRNSKGIFELIPRTRRPTAQSEPSSFQEQDQIFTQRERVHARGKTGTQGQLSKRKTEVDGRERVIGPIAPLASPLSIRSPREVGKENFHEPHPGSRVHPKHVLFAKLDELDMQIKSRVPVDLVLTLAILLPGGRVT